MKNKMAFRSFLLNENKLYLGQKIGDILNALHDLVENMQGMGTRHLVANAEQIVNRIRRILHSNWGKEEIKYLASLQKAGAAIMRAIEEKDDLTGILPGVAQELQNTMNQLGTPQNDLGSMQPTPTGPPPSLGKPVGNEKPVNQPNPNQPQPGGAAAGQPVPPPEQQPGMPFPPPQQPAPQVPQGPAVAT